MDKLEKILRKYLNNGSNRIDVTMVLALIQQCKKDTKEQLILSGVSISLPSQKDYDNRKLKAMYFKKDTSVGNSVLFTKGEQWQPYNWNYQRTIDYLKEGRLGYEC